MLFSVLWRPERAMSWDVATYADTSSNQAIKDRGQWRCVYSNLGKILITFIADHTVPCRIKLEQKWPCAEPTIPFRGNASA